jgi:radical SAM superfamily enzyme YgiQ (UPF0313 family)
VKVCLISAPTAVEFNSSPGPLCGRRLELAEYPPLGILSLAAVLKRAGIPHEIFDLNRLFCECLQGECAPPPGEFFERAKGRLQHLDAEVVGFSTLSSTYPLTVRLAAEVKRARPDRTVVFGGPQASAVDVETLDAFPFVDVVVRGEAEEILPQVIQAGARLDSLGAIAGIAFRDHGRIVRTPDPRSPPDLDGLPLPAYHLWPRLPHQKSVPIEVGRGCPFACTFCSTSVFFRRRFRLKAPARILEEMRAVRAEYGIGTFTLVHDSFTTDGAKVIAFCHALLASGEKFQWTCSARTDCLDEDLLHLMAQSGCVGIFLGIETGSATLQREINKGLDLRHAGAMVRCADRLGVKTVVSLITGFPGETQEDLRSTVDFMLDTVRCTKVDQQFHLLAPLAGSVICERYHDRLEWDGIFSDMSFQGCHQDGNDQALVLAHPEVFPNFYAVPTAFLARPYLMELREFLRYGLARFRWLMLALGEHGGTLLNAFERWREWRSQRDAVASVGEYYIATTFRRDFLNFVRNACLDASPKTLAIAAFLEYEDALDRAREGGAAARSTRHSTETADLEAVPRRAPEVAVVALDVDYKAIVDCLREKRSPKDVPRRHVVLADRQKGEECAEIIQLTPLAAALLRLCDGMRTVKEIAVEFPHLENDLDRLPPGAACLFALNELARQGLVVFTAGLEPEARATG